MAITISFSMKPQLSIKPGSGWNRERMQSFSGQLAEEMGYHCQAGEDSVIYQLCPEGFLWMSWKKGQIVGSCQTNLAGPGFHAAVIYFLELYASRGALNLYVEDSTGFYQDRDFIRMRRDFFYRWFTRLMEAVLTCGEQADRQLVCWPADYYLPEERRGMVITHIRPFSMGEIGGIVRSGISMAFARDFFIWNEEEKDAYYYRNCALVMMNQECYFMPSSRSRQDRVINNAILDLLERAVDMKPDIPFPREEYLELCQLAKRQPVECCGAPLIPGGERIGCRRGLLFRTIGCMRFAVPGSYLHDDSWKGRTERYYDGDEAGGHDYYICAVSTEGEAQFQEAPFQKENVEEIFSFCSGPARCKAAAYAPEERDGRQSFLLAAQVIYQHQMTIISIRYSDPSEREWALDLIRRVQVISR